MAARKKKTMSDKVVLGCRARDTITGFTGVVVQRIEYLDGDPSLGIAGEELVDGVPPPIQYIDEWRLVRVGVKQR